VLREEDVEELFVEHFLDAFDAPPPQVVLDLGLVFVNILNPARISGTGESDTPIWPHPQSGVVWFSCKMTGRFYRAAKRRVG